MEKEYYLPSEDAASIFSDEVGKLNQHWIEESRPILLGLAIEQGLKKFDAIENFLNTPITLNGKTNKNSTPRIGDATVTMMGKVLASRIRTQLEEGYPEGLFPPPKLLTSKGSISMRWVMYITITEKMTPEEAFIYGTSLATNKG